jgi:AcrR family transcriptional regulator
MSDTQQTTREKILEASLRLFSEKGYIGATTKDIAAESGIAEVTLFRHFATKEKLLEEILSKHSFLPTLKDIMPSIKTLPYEEALIEIARGQLASLSLRTGFIKIMHSEIHIYPEKIKKVYHSFIDEMFNTLAAYFDDMQAEGKLRKFDSFLAARAFFGMFFSYYTTANIFMFKKYSPAETEILIKEYVSFFVEGTIRRN